MRLAAICAALALAACSSANATGASSTSGAGGKGSSSSSASGAGGGDAHCPAYEVPAGTDLMSPAVSFKTEVMGLFNDNCGSSTCHGAASGNQGGLFLGEESAQKGDFAMVLKGLVGVPSNELASMPYVTAGDPSKSYLMHKMDGDQCLFDAACGGSCSAIMPSGLGHGLPVAQRDIVRRWIAQGAQSD